MAALQNSMPEYSKPGVFSESKVGRWADCEDSDDESVSTQMQDDESVSTQMQEILDYHQRANLDFMQELQDLERGLRAKAELFEELSRRNSERCMASGLGSLCELGGFLRAAPVQSLPERAPVQVELRATLAQSTRANQAEPPQTQRASEGAQLQSEPLLQNAVEKLLADRSRDAGGFLMGTGPVLQNVMEKLLADASLLQPAGPLGAPAPTSAELFRSAQALRERLLDSEVLSAPRSPRRRSFEPCD